MAEERTIDYVSKYLQPLISLELKSKDGQEPKSTYTTYNKSACSWINKIDERWM